ncbi:hypothetical protein ANN_17690 [Periplaneta americana]|uniref:Proteasome assembly chaperone 2 n=1 Tax=Periplaneta americana TaxID=6978 RepID=A0ABQ8STM3_PERAM|nr:hypothetical protein ANN_17690 [Periplaneta americana]
MSDIMMQESTWSGFIIDSNVRFKTNEEQPAEVDKEKKNIHNLTIPYYLQKYQLKELEVIGLLFGARGTATLFMKDVFKRLGIPTSIIPISEGLAPLYMQEEQVELWNEFHTTIVLAFIPYDADNDGQDIKEAFCLLRQNSSHDLEPIFQYLEENYVLGRPRGHCHKTPLFPMELLSTCCSGIAEDHESH